MARVTVELPGHFPFSVELEVRVGDLNYGNHLGNDHALGLLHEARRRYLRALGLEEIAADGSGLVITDAVLVYRAQAFYAERLRIQVAAGDFSSRGCDFYYRVSQAETRRDVVHAKTGIVCFDFHAQKVINMSAAMRAALGGAAGV
ncbi:MAG TPA: thioesterase family protein [Gammaproteobacteria bacterium]|nr:thioesterase family protein [Gammaproteobacteria bacterium]